MFKPSGQSEAPHPDATSSGELAAIVGWLRLLPGCQVSERTQNLYMNCTAVQVFI